MRKIAVHVTLALVVGQLSVLGQAGAQPGMAHTHQEVLTYFYKDSRPERLIGFVESYGSEREWGAYPPLVGFLAAVFRAQPAWIDRLMPARLEGRVAQATAAALRLAGQQDRARSMDARLGNAGVDPRLQAELAGLPTRLEDLRVASPTHLDILWGASFASGNGRHVRKIIDYLARTTNRSEPLALDVAQVAVAMSGGPKDIYGQLRGRHGDVLAREVIYAATALWALSSNAQQHDFVNRTVAAYIAEHPTNSAAKALEALRRRR